LGPVQKIIIKMGVRSSKMVESGIIKHGPCGVVRTRKGCEWRFCRETKFKIKIEFLLLGRKLT
jgi:hypothetical protein